MGDPERLVLIPTDKEVYESGKELVEAAQLAKDLRDREHVALFDLNLRTEIEHVLEDDLIVLLEAKVYLGLLVKVEDAELSRLRKNLEQAVLEGDFVLSERKAPLHLLFKIEAFGDCFDHFPRLLNGSLVGVNFGEVDKVADLCQSKHVIVQITLQLFVVLPEVSARNCTRRVVAA